MIALGRREDSTAPAGMTRAVSCCPSQQVVPVVLTAPLSPGRQHTRVSLGEGRLLPEGWGARNRGDPTTALPLGRAGGWKRVHPQPPHGGLLLGTFPLRFCNVLREALVSGYSGLRVNLA